MNDSKVKKAGLNIVFLIIYQVVIFVCNLILPRLIINTYGSAYNGLISSITQFLSFVSVLRLGVAGATRVSLYKSLAESNTRKTSKIIKATENYMRRIGIIILLYVAVLAVVYPVIVSIDIGAIETSMLIVAIGLGTFAQYFFGITYQTLLQADQKLYIYNILQTMTTIINTCISCVMIVSGFSIQSVKFISALIFVISPWILNVIVVHMYNIDKDVIPDVAALSKKNDVMGHSIANIVNENTDILVLTFFCDIKLVSVYTVYNLVVNGLKQMMSIFTTGLEAAFGNMWMKQEWGNVRKNLRHYEFLIGCFVSVIFSSTFVLILPFIRIYTKAVNDINYILPGYATIVVTAQAFYCFRMPYLTLVQAAGKYKETKRGAYFEATVNVIVSIFLVQFIGINGVAVGTLLANTIRTVQYSIFVSNNLINRKKREVFLRLGWIILNLLLTIVILYPITVQYASKNWFAWGICGSISVAISGIITIINSLIFYSSDMAGLLELASRMFGKKKG